MTITLRAVGALAPGEAIWDGAVKGFGIRRQRDAAVYVLKYRLSGRQRFFTIGRHGSPWTPDTARKEARRLLGLVAAGKDPADAKATARVEARLTLRGVADDYLRHAKTRQRPRSYLETERHLLGAWKPLHSTPITEISRRHVAQRLTDLSGVTGARARAALSAMFNWAIREGIAEVNPVAGTNRPPEPRSRERVMADAELTLIWNACADDDYGRIVRLLMLTAQRRDEVGAMEWSELTETTWTIPGARTKNHREHALPFTPAMTALLPDRREGREFVFGRGDGPFSGWSQCKSRLDARILSKLQKNDPEAELTPWRLHDLRRTAATVMADRLGVLPHIVEAVLNHVSGHRAGVAGVYNRAVYSAEMRRALVAWGEHVASLAKVESNA